MSTAFGLPPSTGGFGKRLAVIFAAIAVAASTVGFFVLTSVSADAHTPHFKGDCNGIQLKGTSYQKGGKNSYTLTLNGKTVSSSGDFGTSFDTGVIPVPQDGTASSWSYQITAWDDPDGKQGWTVSDHGTLKVCGTPSVTPVAPSVHQSVCTGPGQSTSPSVSLPTTAGIAYSYDSSSRTVTATADGGHKLAANLPSGWVRVDDHTATYKVTFSSPGDCTTTVTPVPPSISQADECGVAGSYTIPSTTGLDYYLDGKQVSAGTHSGPAQGTITAKAHNGYKLSDSGWSYALDVQGTEACPTVTAVPPAVVQSHQCEVQGTYTIPSTPGVKYYLDGKHVKAGTHQGPAEGTITAKATGTSKLTNPGFSFALNVAKAQDCPKAKDTESSAPKPKPPVPTAVEAGLAGDLQPSVSGGSSPWTLLGGGLLSGGLLVAGVRLGRGRRGRGAREL